MFFTAAGGLDENPSIVHRPSSIVLIPISTTTRLFSSLNTPSRMLNLHRLSEQFSNFSAYQADQQRQRAGKLERARAALEDCAGAWEALRDQVEQNRPTPLVAGLREVPNRCVPGGERPTPVSVVATDGSQIYPDRHVEPTCFVLNVGRVAFQYGTLDRPVLEAEPFFHYREDDLIKCYDAVMGAMTPDFVSALRDEKELEALLGASRAARTDGRPLVAMADGTLIRWMIRRMQNRDLERMLIEGYTALLRQFQEERIPLCSYVSMPGGAEMVELLRIHRGEHEGAAPPEETIEGLLDRWLFARTLAPGERSATFASFSHIQAEYDVGDRICYFYVHVPADAGEGEIGRVEVPEWVAEDEALVDLIHSVVLDECRKGGGYPMILSEAHEQAVIRAQEKEVFYQMMERRMADEGLRFSGSRKQAAKRVPLV